MKKGLYIEKILGLTNKGKNLSKIFETFDLHTNFDQEQGNYIDKLFSEKYSFKDATQMQKVDPSNKLLLQRQKKQQQQERLNYFQMKPHNELTPEEKNELILLQLRNVMNPKSYYKSSDFKKLPKVFQVGTVVEGNDAFPLAKIPRKKRQPSLLDHYIKEDQESQYTKKKFLEIQSEKKKYSKNRKFMRLKKFTKRIKKTSGKKIRK